MVLEETERGRENILKYDLSSRVFVKRIDEDLDGEQLGRNGMERNFFFSGLRASSRVDEEEGGWRWLSVVVVMKC